MAEPDPLYYETWVEREGIDLIRGFQIDDVFTLPLKPHARTGGFEVRVQLEGTGDLNDMYVCEIPPGKQLEPQKHLYEEPTYILSGQGSTTVWYEGQRKTSFEWQAGSLFAIPLNAWYQHFNLSGTNPIRYVAVTTAPVVMNLFHNDDFVFANPVTFPDRFDGGDDFFTSRFGMRETSFRETGVDKFEVAFTNFVYDINAIPPQKSARAPGARGRVYQLGRGKQQSAHSTLIPGRTFSNIHRHGPGSHVLWLSGEGYALMWPDGGEKLKVHFRRGSVIVPPTWWWHHWAVTSAEPAQDLAFHLGGVDRSHRGTMISQREGGLMVPLDDFPPDLLEEVQHLFNEECRAYDAQHREESPRGGEPLHPRA